MSLKCKEWIHKKSLDDLKFFCVCVYQSEFNNHVMMVGTVLDFWQNLHFSCLGCLLKSHLILGAVVSMPLSFCAFDNTRGRFLVGMKLPLIYKHLPCPGVQFTEGVCNFVCSTRLNDRRISLQIPYRDCFWPSDTQRWHETFRQVLHAMMLNI